ncbi:uncharacterized protein [Montipora capricornis]|uniref:uncharacterized protein n=1 Tax=Montipora capricornis TaxID=246305 RepID=UPI0035F18B8B
MASVSWQQSQEHGPTKVQVTILASEWGSSEGGLSTINRELAIQLAKFPEVQITYFLPKCSEEDRKVALSYGIKILEATRLPGYDELEWLSFPPEHLRIDFIVGHGVKLGHQAQVIRNSHKCKWIQVIHTDPEEIGMFKCYENLISKAEEKHNVEVELCEMANFIVGVGPKMAEAFRNYLRSCKKDQDVIDFIPGIFDEFVCVQQVPEERKQLSVLVFSCGDAEDFKLKGFDIAARSVAALHDTCFVFVGAPDGKQEEIANRLLECGVPENRLSVRGYIKSRESLKQLFCEVDLVLMPSRTEGFSLTGLEALSAGLPVIISKNSGFGEALGDVPCGSSFVIDSEDPNVWTAAIMDIWNKNRQTRLDEARALRDSYGTKYSWSEQCKDLVKKMVNLFNDASRCGPRMASEAQGKLERKSYVSTKEQTHLLFTSESFPSSSVASYRTEDSSFSHPEPSQKKEEQEEVKLHADASCDVHMLPEAQGRLHIKSSEDEKGGKKRKLCLPVPEDCYDMPPKLRVKPPKLSDLPIASKPWRNADLPIDILLITVEDCEFLSCFSFLDRPFKSYKIEVGPIYFGYTGNTGDQEKLKVALMKCSKGAAVPGGSLTAVKNAVRFLSPKAVFSVGTCSGLSSDKVKLGDVVVSAKLTIAAGFKCPVSRHMSDLVSDAPYGWVAPWKIQMNWRLKYTVMVILSQTQAARCGCADLHLQYPEAIAVETEGQGVFTVAYDEKVEWVAVKGVARFAHQTQLSRSEWMFFASTMAASVVAKMLNDPVVFQEWPHCNQDIFTDHGLPQKKAREEEKECKQHADVSTKEQTQLLFTSDSFPSSSVASHRTEVLRVKVVS